MWFGAGDPWHRKLTVNTGARQEDPLEEMKVEEGGRRWEGGGREVGGRWVGGGC